MTKKLRTITELKNIRGKRVLVRVDFNVTIVKGKVVDDFRIKAALPTIEYLQKKGAKIILVSHLGEKGESLAPVSKVFKKYVAHTFITDTNGERAYGILNTIKNGDVVLLENLRQHSGEAKNDPRFAKALASLADIYINDAFSVSHRTHASIVGVPKYLPAYAGLHLVREVRALSAVMAKPKRPLLFILGGAKFSTKMPLVKKYLAKADYVFIGGALANDFFKAQGYEVGISLTSGAVPGIKALLAKKNLFLPVDVIAGLGKKREVKLPESVGKQDVIADIGPMSIALLELLIGKSKTILWNGPMGKYEDGFGGATETILQTLANSSAETIVGGGDTAALVSKLKLGNKLSFVSTGGGATLDYLAHGTLPGIRALVGKKSRAVTSGKIL